MIKCILFDCDGTLVDSERLCNLALVQQFRSFGVNLDVEQLVIRFRGWKLAALLKELETEYALRLPDNFVPSYKKAVADLFEAELKPIEAIHPALDKLAHAKAVVSSGPVPKIRQALRICELSHYFGDNIYSSYDVGIWKPDPGIYLHAAKHMGYAVDECAVVDDGPVGVEAGCLAGIRTFFYNRFNEHCKFSEAISFQSMQDLPGLFSAAK